MFWFHSFTYSFPVFPATVIEACLSSIVYSCLLCHRLIVYSNSVGKESASNAGDPGLIPGSGRCPGEGNGNLLQYAYLRIPWTEELSWLQSMGSQELGTTYWLNHQSIIGAWAHFWHFYPVPWICISLFVPIPYCLGCYSFVVYAIKTMVTVSHNSHYKIIVVYLNVKNLFLPLPSWENFDEISFLPGQNLNLLFDVVLFTLFLQSHIMTSLSPYFSTLFSTFLRVTEMSYVFDHHMSEMTHLLLFHHHSRTLYHLNCSTKINYLLWFSLYVISCHLFPSLVIILQFFLTFNKIPHIIYIE